jgi:hypothetical protein
MGGVISTETWESLGAPNAGHGLVRTRVSPHAPIDIFVAVEHPSSAKLVLFGLDAAEQAALIDLPQASGIRVQAIPTPNDSGWGYAEVRLVDGRYDEVFTALANDLADHVSRARDGSVAIGRLVDRLRRWEAFLKLVGPEGLSHERRAGLYGELHVMRRHLLPIDKDVAVMTWVGPQGAFQDFQAPRWAVEVKTSRTKEPVSVRISGERQLDDLGLDFLGVAHIGLEERRNSGETLPEIVASVRAMLADTAVAETFEGQLLGAGYLSIHESRYQSDGYLVRFDELFHVREGFPRVTERDLPSGVGELSYSVVASALNDFRVDWNVLTALVSQSGQDG